MEKLEMEILNDILASEEPIQTFADSVLKLRINLDNILTDEENLKLTSRIKDKVQREANTALDDNGGSGIVIGATGIGKSKIAVDRVVQFKKDKDFNLHTPKLSLLLVTPTEKLRDEGWRDEFAKWLVVNVYDSCITSVCYASLNTLTRTDWDLIILDEYHNITDNNSEFFFSQGNSWSNLLLMSATKPTNRIKDTIINRLKLKVVYEIDTDTAVKLGLVAPYDITVVTVPLERKIKDVKAGTKDKPFYTTEYSNYQYLFKLCFSSPNKMNFLKRMRFIYNLKSKTDAIKSVLSMIPTDVRTLIFCGSKDQANQVCDFRYYSKPSKPKMPVKLRGSFDKNSFETAATGKMKEYIKYAEDIKVYETQLKEYQSDISLNNFKKGIINKLACCEALNEGENIDNIDCGLIGQLNSNPLNTIQRIGRIIRYRVGHRGRIIILCSTETEDRNWVRKATSGLNNINITIVGINDLISGKETIQF